MAARLAFSVFFLMALSAPGDAVERGRTVTLGIGALSCANWQMSRNSEMAGQHWIMGFWTGLNVHGQNHMVGEKTDAPAIWAEVWKICSESPSMTLLDATGTHYERVKQQLR